MTIPPHFEMVETKISQNKRGEKQVSISFSFENGYTVYLSWGGDYNSNGTYIPSEGAFFTQEVQLRIWNSSKGFSAISEVADKMGKKIRFDKFFPLLQNVKVKEALAYIMVTLTME